MMDYLLTDEQRMLRETVEDFAREKVGPLARRNDEQELFPADIIKEAAELGLLGIPYPEVYGGSNMDTVSYFLAVEALSRYCASTGVILSAHSSLCEEPIFAFGTDEQKKKYLPDLCQGRTLGCLCLTEPQAGSDAGALKTSAKRDGDFFVLNGTKQFITNAVQADVAIVFASTHPEAGGKGITAFIVDKSMKGFRPGKVEHKLGIRGSSTAEVIFEDCRVPVANQLGELNHGFKVALTTLDGGRIGIAGQALGIARAALEDATAYAKERVQFGKPIAAFQGTKWVLSGMATAYESAWLLAWRAAVLKDRKLPYAKEAAMAKLAASEASEHCASKAIQIHGGYGYIREFNVERYYRDAKITQIYEGTSEIMREIIASYILK